MLFALALTTTVTAVVTSLGAPMVPMVAAKFGTSLSAAQWSLTATLVAGAVATPIMGRLGGGSRCRKVILLGLALVSAGLVLAAASPSFAWLILGRTLQGVGIGLTPLAMAAAHYSLRDPARGNAIALLSVTTVAGAGLGYPLTAAVSEWLGLAGAYSFGFLLCAATLMLAIVFVPDVSGATDIPVDWTGAALLTVGVVGILAVLSQGGVRGWADPALLCVLFGSMAVLWIWGWWSTAISAPLVDLRLARRRGVIGANLTAVLAGIGTYTLFSLVTLLVQTPSDRGGGLGESVVVAGLLLVPFSIFSVIGSWFARVQRLVSAEMILPVGCLMFGCSTLALALLEPSISLLVAVMAVAGVGGGCTFGALPGLVVRFAPTHEIASAIAFNQVLKFIGFAAGSALTVAVLDLATPDDLTGPTAYAFSATALAGTAAWFVAAGISLILGWTARLR